MRIRASKTKREVTTYFLSKWTNFMSMEWMEVKIAVLPWTTHSRVSGIATGVQVAKKTGSFRLHKGRKLKKCPWINTTWNKTVNTWLKLPPSCSSWEFESAELTFWSPNLIWRRALRETFMRHRNIRSSSVGDTDPRINSDWAAWWSCLSMMS